MKFVVIVTSLLLPVFSWAVQNGYTPEFTCMNELPTTMFIATPMKSAGEEFVEFKVVHVFGAGNAPIHNGVITMNDLPYLKAKGEVIQKLGDQFVVKFKKSNCQKFGDGLFSCAFSEEVEINGTKIEGYSFATREMNSKVYDYNFKSRQVVFSFLYESMSYDMPMDFSETECQFKN